MLRCPICEKTLRKIENCLRCETGHSFDCAKSGYVNLLRPQKEGKTPGDNRLMVEARKRFLEKGYYAPLCQAFSQMAVGALAGKARPKVLDAGCGEGYYTAALAQALCETEAELVGIDISKIAADKGAKLEKRVQFAVASVFHLPVADQSCDLLTNLFAPYCGEEYRRVLKQDGRMLLVIPGELHLWELKQAVYEIPYKNEVKDYALEGFTLKQRKTVCTYIELDGQEDIQNLFFMTPYYYKTGEKDQEKLQVLSRLRTQISFELLLYSKSE